MNAEIKLTRSWFVIGVLALVVGLLFLTFGCKSPTSPHGDGEADIIVYSRIEGVLDIYMDGSFRFSIRYKNSIEIDNVSMGIHQLKALDQKTGIVVDSETIEVIDKTDYTWTIEDPADINVINNYGQALKIYMDDNYLFDLADEEDRWIIDVSLGEHLLKAIRVRDGKQAGSKLLNITENRNYYWTISMITASVEGLLPPY